MRLRNLQVAKEDSSSNELTQAKAMLSAISNTSIKTFADLKGITRSGFYKYQPRPFSYLGIPLTDNLFILTMFFIRADTYDVEMMTPVILHKDASSNLLFEVLKQIELNYAKDFDRGIYYDYSVDEMADAISLVSGYKVSLTPKQIKDKFYSQIDEYIAQANMFVLEDNLIDAMVDDIKQALQTTIQGFIDSRTTPASAATSTPAPATPQAPTDVNSLCREMQITGGEFSFNGRTGLIVQVYYDYQTHKNRVRTNDGIHGVANVAFPNAWRDTDSVYLIPPYLVSWNGKNYRVSSSLDCSTYKIR